MTSTGLGWGLGTMVPGDHSIWMDPGDVVPPIPLKVEALSYGPEILPATGYLQVASPHTGVVELGLKPIWNSLADVETIRMVADSRVEHSKIMLLK